MWADLAQHTLRKLGTTQGRPHISGCMLYAHSGLTVWLVGILRCYPGHLGLEHTSEGSTHAGWSDLAQQILSKLGNDPDLAPHLAACWVPRLWMPGLQWCQKHQPACAQPRAECMLCGASQLGTPRRRGGIGLMCSVIQLLHALQVYKLVASRACIPQHTMQCIVKVRSRPAHTPSSPYSGFCSTLSPRPVLAEAPWRDPAWLQEAAQALVAGTQPHLVVEPPLLTPEPPGMSGHVSVTKYMQERE